MYRGNGEGDREESMGEEGTEDRVRQGRRQGAGKER